MDENNQSKSSSSNIKYASGAFLLSAVVAFGLMRRGNYSAAILFYSKTGGGGLNIHKTQDDGRIKRCFAIDYHPFWDKDAKNYDWKLHYHRGSTDKELKKHRPYEGGW